MLHEYDVTYSLWYYPRFHVTVIGLGMHYPQIRGPSVFKNYHHTCGPFQVYRVYYLNIETLENYVLAYLSL